MDGNDFLNIGITSILSIIEKSKSDKGNGPRFTFLVIIIITIDIFTAGFRMEAQNIQKEEPWECIA